MFGGVFFVVVTAIEMMAFGTDAQGVAAFTKSEALMGDLSAAVRRAVAVVRDRRRRDVQRRGVLPGQCRWAHPG